MQNACEMFHKATDALETVTKDTVFQAMMQLGSLADAPASLDPHDRESAVTCSSTVRRR